MLYVDKQHQHTHTTSLKISDRTNSLSLHSSCRQKCTLDYKPRTPRLAWIIACWLSPPTPPVRRSRSSPERTQHKSAATESFLKHVLSTRRRSTCCGVCCWCRVRLGGRRSTFREGAEERGWRGDGGERRGAEALCRAWRGWRVGAWVRAITGWRTLRRARQRQWRGSRSPTGSLSPSC